MAARPSPLLLLWGFVRFEGVRFQDCQIECAVGHIYVSLLPGENCYVSILSSTYQLISSRQHVQSFKSSPMISKSQPNSILPPHLSGESFNKEILSVIRLLSSFFCHPVKYLVWPPYYTGRATVKASHLGTSLLNSSHLRWELVCCKADLHFYSTS
jgi:hypothetical protein